MYLPAILLRNWGWPGFWVFAIFNVLGCAGFGYLCSRERSERLCSQHSGAMMAFSAVTVAYQVFFVCFVVTQLRGEAGSSPLPVTWFAGFGAIAAGLIISASPDRWWPWLGAIASAASYATWIALGTDRLGVAPATGTETRISLMLAVPIIAFGFLLCPWLDLSFHRARQAAPSVHAFGVFGLTFFPIILMTAAYGATGRLDPTAPILTHLATQLIFTIAVHFRELRLNTCGAPVPVPYHGVASTDPTPVRTEQASMPVPSSDRSSPALAPGTKRWALLGPSIAGIVVAELCGHDLASLETIYLLFLGCYGLVFPAYVLLFVPLKPTAILGLRPWPLTRRAILLFGVLIALLAPLCAAGFIRLQTWMLPIALVSVIAAAFSSNWLFRTAQRGGRAG
jgi:hypothetical protein